MQFLWLFLFIGVIQCDNSNINSKIVPPDSFTLDIPCPVEYISFHILAVKSAYITSAECMISSKHYMKTGIAELDDTLSKKEPVSTEPQKYSDDFQGVEDILSKLKQTQQEEIKGIESSMIFMTGKYYKKESDVKDMKIPLGDLSDANNAQSVLYALRCASSYNDFMNQSNTLKEKYGSSNNGDWDAAVKKYDEVRADLVTKSSNWYGPLRDTFIFGSGLNLCKGSSDTKMDLLEIYKTKDLAQYFGIENNAEELFRLTVVRLYEIYKNAMAVTYLNSVCHTEQDRALRMLIWVHMNVVRANVESMSHCLILHIQYIQKCAESKFTKESNEYNDAMKTLFIRVNKKLLTIVASTQISYQRAMEFNPDGSMLNKNYGTYNISDIDVLYNSLIWQANGVSNYDMRLMDKKSSPYPTQDSLIPQNLYCLKANTLIFKSIICYLNFLCIKFYSSVNEKTDSTTWTYNTMSIKELELSIVFLKYSVEGNKLLSIIAATYSHISTNPNVGSQSVDTTKIMDQISADVISILSANSIEVLETFSTVNNYIITNNKPTGKPIVYRPGVSGLTPNTGNDGSLKTRENSTSVTPVGNFDNNTPVNTNGSPTNTNGSPANINGSPTNTNGSPANTNGSPANTNGNSANTNVNPANTNNSSTNTNDSPANINDSPANTNGSPQNTNGSPDNTNTGLPNTNNGNVGNDKVTKGSTVFENTNTYVGVKSSAQVVEMLTYLQVSVTQIITTTTTMSSQLPSNNNYAKLTTTLIKSVQEIFNWNYEYLSTITTKAVEYINANTPPDSEENRQAIVCLYEDTNEKKSYLLSSIEVPIKRCNLYSTATQINEYVFIEQTIDYNQYVLSFYKFFEINYNEVDNKDFDVELYIECCLKIFTTLHGNVMNNLNQTSDDKYKSFLVDQLESTLEVYQKTCQSLKNEVAQMVPIIKELGEKSIETYYLEFKNRMNAIIAIYTTVFTVCFQYSKSISSVSILVSDYDVLITQTQITTYTYTSEVTTSSLVQTESDTQQTTEMSTGNVQEDWTYVEVEGTNS